MLGPAFVISIRNGFFKCTDSAKSQRQTDKLLIQPLIEYVKNKGFCLVSLLYDPIVDSFNRTDERY